MIIFDIYMSYLFMLVFILEMSAIQWSQNVIEWVAKIVQKKKNQKALLFMDKPEIWTFLFLNQDGILYRSGGCTILNLMLVILLWR